MPSLNADKNCNKRIGWPIRIFAGRTLGCSARFFFVCAFLPAILWGQGASSDADFKIGGLYFDAQAFLDLTFSDNINSSGVDPRSDAILRTGVSMGAAMDIGTISELSVNFSASYRKYLRNSELDSVNAFLAIGDNTASDITAEIRADNLTGRVYYQFSFDDDPTGAARRDTNGNVSFDLLQFARWNNTLGANLVWDANAAVATLGISRNWVLPVDTDFEFLERITDSLTLQIHREIGKERNLGVRGSISQSTYPEEDFQNDSRGYSLGAYIDWRFTDEFAVNADVTYRPQNFGTNGANGDTSDPANIDFSIQARNQLNNKYSHSLGYTRSTDLGFVTNTTTTSTLTYGWAWSIISKTTFTGDVFWGTGSDSGGFAAEDFDRFGFGLRLNRILGPDISGYIQYRYSEKSSSDVDRSYESNSLSIGLNYDF